MISKYLKVLIESNNRIIIPDFGAFMIQDSPEGKQISFNDFLKFNDGLLVNQIIKTDKISKDQATGQLKDFIKAVEKSFTQKKPYHLEGVGYLSKDNHGNIKFETKIEGAKTEEKTAPTDVKPTIELATEPKKTEAKKEVKKVTKEEPEAKTVAKEVKKEEVKVKAEPIANKVTASTETKAKATPEPKPEVKKETPKPLSTKPTTTPTQKKPTSSKTSTIKTSDNSNTTTIIIVIAAVLVLLIGGFFLLKAMGVIGGEKEPVQEQVVQVPEPVVDTIPQDTLVEDTIIEEPTVIEEPAVEEPKYYLIGGSFKVVSNAERFNQKLINEGYNSDIVVRDNGFNCVSYSSYLTWEEVLAGWRDMKSQNPQIWILKK